MADQRSFLQTYLIHIHPITSIIMCTDTVALNEFLCSGARPEEYSWNNSRPKFIKILFFWEILMKQHFLLPQMVLFSAILSANSLRRSICPTCFFDIFRVSDISINFTLRSSKSILRTFLMLSQPLLDVTVFVIFGANISLRKWLTNGCLPGTDVVLNSSIHFLILAEFFFIKK